MNSGIIIPDEVVTEFKNLALKRKYRYIIYKPSDDFTSVEIAKIGGNDDTWEDFKNSIEPTDSL